MDVFLVTDWGELEKQISQCRVRFVITVWKMLCWGFGAVGDVKLAQLSGFVKRKEEFYQLYGAAEKK